MLAVHNFSYGLLTPVLGYAMSCLGAFIGLRCTTRAYAYQGAERVRWLLLAAISIGTTGIWAMHFIAMLGYTVPGTIIHYSIPVTIGSMLIAVIVVAGGLLIVGLGRQTWPNIILAGILTGIGVAAMHYSGMAAMHLQARMSFRPALVGLSVVIAIVATTAALWAAVRLRRVAVTLGAALIMGIAVSGMHYTGMAAMVMHRVAAGTAVSTSGATAQGFLLPLIIGLGVVSIFMIAVLVFSPTEAEIREDRELMERINAATARLAAAQPLAAQPTTATQWAAAGRSPAAAPPAAGPAASAGFAGQFRPFGGAAPGGAAAGGATRPARPARADAASSGAAAQNGAAGNGAAQHNSTGWNAWGTRDGRASNGGAPNGMSQNGGVSNGGVSNGGAPQNGGGGRPGAAGPGGQGGGPGGLPSRLDRRRPGPDDPPGELPRRR